jgi:hypothetical protein
MPKRQGRHFKNQRFGIKVYSKLVMIMELNFATSRNQKKNVPTL